ncbi:hypothetical protein FNV43_RR14051 [Rhamnella rubrinervis]|uniref:Uncharacterized protein n=1 Tax=Rhamnella rubrinervis TaxID=2594499 RepID=A0A8K0H2B6_9ROSA|nr:hypothetical protein FNV43_RR14051 [Rhamnella rubrinervis]
MTSSTSSNFLRPFQELPSAVDNFLGPQATSYGLRNFGHRTASYGRTTLGPDNFYGLAKLPRPRLNYGLSQLPHSGPDSTTALTTSYGTRTTSYGLGQLLHGPQATSTAFQNFLRPQATYGLKQLPIALEPHYELPTAWTTTSSVGQANFSASDNFPTGRTLPDAGQLHGPPQLLRPQEPSSRLGNFPLAFPQLPAFSGQLPADLGNFLRPFRPDQNWRASGSLGGGGDQAWGGGTRPALGPDQGREEVDKQGGRTKPGGELDSRGRWIKLWRRWIKWEEVRTPRESDQAEEVTMTEELDKSRRGGPSRELDEPRRPGNRKSRTTRRSRTCQLEEVGPAGEVGQSRRRWDSREGEDQPGGRGQTRRRSQAEEEADEREVDQAGMPDQAEEVDQQVIKHRGGGTIL